MANIMRISDENQDEVLEAFKEFLSNDSYPDGNTLQYSLPIKVEGKATVEFSEDAWKKIQALVREFDTEIGWHGIAERSDADDTKFFVSDIKVYPQKVTGGTTTTDDLEYGKWVQSFDKDEVERMRFHGHSHVNMQAFMSATDKKHQITIAEELWDDNFFIFMVFNKHGDFYTRIYDAKKNIVYQNDDVSVCVSTDTDTKEFVENSRKMLKDATVVPKLYKYSGSDKHFANSWYHLKRGFYDGFDEEF